MVSIKSSTARIADSLRETTPKLLQTAPVLPVANFSIAGQLRPFFSCETILQWGAFKQIPPAPLEVETPTLGWLPDLWWSRRSRCQYRKQRGRFAPPVFPKMTLRSTKLFQDHSFSRSQKNPDSQEKEMPWSFKASNSGDGEDRMGPIRLSGNVGVVLEGEDWISAPPHESKAFLGKLLHLYESQFLSL